MSAPNAPSCRDCSLFEDDPAVLEREWPGLTILSSAYGSTRGSSGLCRARDTLQDPEPACPEYSPRVTVR